MKPLYLSLLIAILLIGASACASGSSSTPAPTQPPAIQPLHASAYPEPGASSPYPYPNAGETSNSTPYPGGSVIEGVATPGPIPAPGKDTGVITGRLLGDGKPAFDAILYLAEVKKDEKGQELMAALSILSSPRAYTDREGRFVFSNVPPGKYGLVLDTVMTEYLLHMPDKAGTELLFVAEAGQTTDLGDLDYKDLPVQP